MDEDFEDFPDAASIKSSKGNENRREGVRTIEYLHGFSFGYDKEKARHGYIKESLLKSDEKEIRKDIKKDRRKTIDDIKSYPYRSILSLEMRVDGNI